MPRAAADSAALADEPVSVRSGLLPVLHERAGAQAGMRILDLGLPSNGLLEYLCGTRCRVYYYTFTTALPVRLQNHALDNRPAINAFTSELKQAGFPRFDAVLLWDYLEYLPPGLPEEFLRSVQHLCQPGAWLYLQTHQSVSMPEHPSRFYISSDADGSACITCASDPLPLRQQAARRTAPKILLKWLPGFAIHKLYLMQDVKQEHLFSYTE